jgi:hypothetical protein
MQTHGRTNGGTDITKLIVVLRNFANAPKSGGFELAVWHTAAVLYPRLTPCLRPQSEVKEWTSRFHTEIHRTL